MKYQKFQKSYDEAINTIELLLIPTPDEKSMDGLVRWMLETDANPHGFLPEGWGGSLSTAEGFAGLLNHLHHALYDDGDVTFVTVDDQPRIVFAHRFDEFFRERVLTEQEISLERDNARQPRWKLEYKIEVLDINPSEFGPLYDQHHTAWLRECFLGDSRHGDIEYNANHYRKYKQWNESWIEEARLSQKEK